MAFIDNLKDAAQKAKETVKTTAAAAGEKTKGFVEIQKLTSSIHDEEKLIEAWKKEIGEFYWNKYLLDAVHDEEVTDLCAKIAASLERIASLEDEIESYKQKKEEALPADEPEPSGKFCPSCGTKSSYNAAFCSNCGKDLRGL